jgi:hypothetical protein
MKTEEMPGRPKNSKIYEKMGKLKEK